MYFQLSQVYIMEIATKPISTNVPGQTWALSGGRANNVHKIINNKRLT